MKVRIAQLDEWIAEGRAFVAEADRKISELGDVFQMMMVKNRVKDLDGLVAMFREAEAKKFKTYTYIQVNHDFTVLQPPVIIR